jgi:hypothetical protein
MFTSCHTSIEHQIDLQFINTVKFALQRPTCIGSSGSETHYMLLFTFALEGTFFSDNYVLLQKLKMRLIFYVLQRDHICYANGIFSQHFACVFLVKID